MSERTDRFIVRADSDSHILFSMFKAYYVNSTLENMLLGHKHTMIEVSCILSGCGIYTCNGEDYEFKPGSIFLHPSNEPHYFSSVDGKSKPALLVLHFDPGFIWSLSSEWSCSQYMKIFTRGNAISHMIPADTVAAGEIARLLDEMYEECHGHEPAYELMVKARLMMILSTIVRHFSEELEKDLSSVASKQHLERMEQSTKYILKHLGEPLTLESVAKEACLSRSYYSNIFKSLYGVSVWEFILNQRVELAKYKLETGTAPITAVCEESGFSSIGNFNRAFKKATGLSPREYRQSILSEKE